MKSARQPAIKTWLHRTHRPGALNTERMSNTMESFRNAIIKMLDTVTDERLMRMLYHVVHAIIANRFDNGGYTHDERRE